MKKIKVGITHGDINGISYEIIIKALSDSRIYDKFIPIVYGSSKVLAYHRKVLNFLNFNLNSINKISEINPKRANIINVIDGEVKIDIGKSTEIAGKSSLIALERATKDLKNGDIDVLVTAPINKKNIQSKDFNFNGHTKYLQQKFESKESLMFMINEHIKIGVVTGHIALNKVAKKLTIDKILSKLTLMNKSLKQDFVISKPKIAVLGLNPHAGDDGLIGNEEKDIIIPAIEKARENGILAFGVFPTDGFFGSDMMKKYDAVLAMYHDQGLAPFKILSFGKGVNFTAGLSVVRTSPDHGTAYDIAGKNIANENSLKQAIFLALDIYKNRKMNEELEKNKLLISK